MDKFEYKVVTYDPKGLWGGNVDITMIEEHFKPENLIFVPVGQSTGCNVGPGLAAAFYAGDEPVSPYCEKEKEILEKLLKE